MFCLSTVLITMHIPVKMDGESCFYSCCNNLHHPVNSDGGFILLVPLSQFFCCISDESVRQTKVALTVRSNSTEDNA